MAALICVDLILLCHESSLWEWNSHFENEILSEYVYILEKFLFVCVRWLDYFFFLKLISFHKYNIFMVRCWWYGFQSYWNESLWFIVCFLFESHIHTLYIVKRMKRNNFGKERFSTDTVYDICWCNHQFQWWWRSKLFFFPFSY